MLIFLTRIVVHTTITVERTLGMANPLFLLPSMNGTGLRLEIMISKMANPGMVKRSGISPKSFGRKQRGLGVLKPTAMTWMVTTMCATIILQETSVVRMCRMYCQ